MSVSSNLNSELNNYFTKIHLEKLNTKNPLSRGTSTNLVKKIATLNKRNNSDSFFGENSPQTIFLEKNVSKLYLLKEEEYSNLNLNNNANLVGNSTGSHPLDSYILKHKSQVLPINRKKDSISPLQLISNSPRNPNNINANINSHIIINDNSNNIKVDSNIYSVNTLFGNAESKKNQINVKCVNDGESRHGTNEFGTIDIKFEIKNKQFQLPNLYPEKKFKKINNNHNAGNVKRINNSVTPNKFLYNSENISSIIIKKEVNLNGGANSKGIRRFNYPSATQILHNRVNNFF